VESGLVREESPWKIEAREKNRMGRQTGAAAKIVEFFELNSKVLKCTSIAYEQGTQDQNKIFWSWDGLLTLTFDHWGWRIFVNTVEPDGLRDDMKAWLKAEMCHARLRPGNTRKK
jgi:hypothetical protein